MTEVGAFEAKNKLSALLERAEKGEEIVITRRGKPVAKIVPFESSPGGDQARLAADRIRALAKAMARGPYDWEALKRDRDEGRR